MMTNRKSLTLLVLAGLVVSLLGANRADPERDRRIKCAGHLREISIAVRKFVLENNGTLPLSITELTRGGDLKASACICPGSKDTAATSKMADDASARAAGNLSYVWAGSRAGKALNDGDLIADTIVVIEPIRHHSEGSNIVFVDGHISFESTRFIQDAVKDLLKDKRITQEEADWILGKE